MMLFPSQFKNIPRGPGARLELSPYVCCDALFSLFLRPKFFKINSIMKVGISGSKEQLDSERLESDSSVFFSTRLPFIHIVTVI